MTGLAGRSPKVVCVGGDRELVRAGLSAPPQGSQSRPRAVPAAAGSPGTRSLPASHRV